MYTITVSKIKEFLLEITKYMCVYAPIKENNTTDFRVLNTDSQIDLDVVKTNKSPKDLFFLDYQNIVEFQINKNEIIINNLEKKDDEILIFGMKACDEKGIRLLDKVFLEDPIDEFYQNKRKNTIIITLACNKFDENCFCTNFGIDPASPSGDISTFEFENNLVFEPNTEKGYRFINRFSNLFDTIELNLNEIKDNINKKFQYLPLRNLNLKYFKDNSLLDIFNNSKWDELSKTCLGCGSCTYFCPTCQCYDIRDFQNKNIVTRYRCWDSCMYKDFTLMAGGGNPRKTQKERFRQRFMHKLVYFPQNNNGELGCVGCGRCLKVCPNSLNIVNVIKRMGE